MLKIGEFSKLAKTTVKTLRYYDEVDLLKPVFVDNNGYRYYNIDQLETLLKIVRLRNLDFAIADVKSALASGDIKLALQKHLIKLQTELTKKEQQISLLSNYIKMVEKGDFMQKYKVKEIIVPEQNVYYRHGVIDSMANLVDYVMQAGAECAKHNPDLKCTGYCYVTYTAKEYKEKDVELEYVEAVESIGKDSENIKFRVDPEIKAISVEHKGSYMGLRNAYAFALNYVKEHGYTISAPIREVYIDGCWNCKSEDEYLTEIQIPIA